MCIERSPEESIAGEKEEGQVQERDQQNEHVHWKRTPHLAQPAVLPRTPIGVIPVVLLHDPKVVEAGPGVAPPPPPAFRSEAFSRHESTVADAGPFVNDIPHGVDAAALQKPLFEMTIEPVGGKKQEAPQDPKDRNRPVHEAHPGAAPPAPIGLRLRRWEVLRRHESTIAEPRTLVKQMGSGRRMGHHDSVRKLREAEGTTRAR